MFLKSPYICLWPWTLNIWNGTIRNVSFTNFQSDSKVKFFWQTKTLIKIGHQSAQKSDPGCLIPNHLATVLLVPISQIETEYWVTGLGITELLQMKTKVSLHFRWVCYMIQFWLESIGNVLGWLKPCGSVGFKELHIFIKFCGDFLFLDFIRRFLKWDLPSRMNANAALGHAWVHRYMPRLLRWKLEDWMNPILYFIVLYCSNPNNTDFWLSFTALPDKF